MTNKILASINGLAVFLFLISGCFAVAAFGSVETVPLSATIPQQNSLSMSVFKVTGTNWAPATGIDLNALTYDPVKNIFTSSYYFAVEIGIDSNASTWTVTHLRSSISNGTQNLDNNINVSFVKHVISTNLDVAPPLSKVSYANSNNLSFTKSQFTAGEYLRVYYGLATGDPLNDAPGASPLTATKGSGSYSGSVSFTLTP